MDCTPDKAEKTCRRFCCCGLSFESLTRRTSGTLDGGHHEGHCVCHDLTDARQQYSVYLYPMYSVQSLRRSVYRIFMI